MEFTLEVRTYRRYLRDQANLPIASSAVRSTYLLQRPPPHELQLLARPHTLPHSTDLFRHTLVGTHTRTLTHTRTAGRKHGLLHTHTCCPSNMPPTATRLTHPRNYWSLSLRIGFISFPGDSLGLSD